MKPMSLKDASERKKYRRTYYSEHKSKEQRQQKEYRLTHKDDIREQKKRAYASNREGVRSRQQAYYAKTRTKHLARMKENHTKRIRKIRSQLFSVFGSQCQCCGESNERFLTLHHINGGGNKTRREKGREPSLVAAVKSRDKAAYQILCFNCHIGMHANGGTCPHKAETIKHPDAHIGLPHGSPDAKRRGN